jgi:hypothetical protein
VTASETIRQPAIIQCVPQRVPLPHIPDEPTEQGAVAILDHMERGISYFNTGPPEPVPASLDLPFANGVKHELIEVIGINWATGHQDWATVYIDGKPYALTKAGLGNCLSVCLFTVEMQVLQTKGLIVNLAWESVCLFTVEMQGV